MEQSKLSSGSSSRQKIACGWLAMDFQESKSNTCRQALAFGG